MDARNKKVLTVLCLASLILAWRVYVVVIRATPAAAQANPLPAPAGIAAVTTMSVEAAGPADKPALWESQQAVAAQPWGRDPFADVEPLSQPGEAGEQAQKPGEAAVTPPSVRFSGVSSSDDNWLAVVQGNIVRVGDLIEGRYKVVEITKQSLTIAVDGWTFRYELGSDAPSIRPPSEDP